MTTLGPDEAVYRAQGEAFRAGRFAALRDLADEFIEEPTLRAYPSPLRWLWATLVGITIPLSDTALQIGAAVIMGPAAWLLTQSWVASAWAAASPLVLTLCRRRLQDVPVALGTVLAIGFAMQHQPIGMAAALAAVLCLKEGAIFAIPSLGAAWVVSGGPFLPLLWSLTMGGVAWLASLALIFGRRVPAMLHAAGRGHGTQYAEQHQKGAPHRLLVDLVLTSPAAVVFAILGAVHQPAIAAAAVTLLVAHSLAPIRNVRFVLAADILLRVVGAAAMAHPFIELPAVLAVDAFIAHRIRHIYDPVTQTLSMALGMPNQTSGTPGSR